MTSPGSESSSWVRLGRDLQTLSWVDRALPAMDYSKAQFQDLAATINSTPCDSIVVTTPVDLAWLISLPKPHCRVRYDLEEISRPDLADVLANSLREHGNLLSELKT